MKNKTNEQLLIDYAKVLDELIERNVLRTRNNPVADYAEYLVQEKMKCSLQPNSKSCYDAIDSIGNRIQIKSRRWNDNRQSKHLGIIRNLHDKKFDQLVVIFFDNGFDVKKAYQMDHKTVVKYAKENEHQHGHILILNNKILLDENIKDITNIFSRY